MRGAAMTPGIYFAGSIALIAAIGVLVLGAVWLRRGLLAEWSGGAARLAEAVLVLAVAIGLGELLGTFGAFRPIPMLIAALAAGVVMAVVGARLSSRHGTVPAVESAPGVTRREEILAMVVAGALVAAQWAAHVGDAVGRGMAHPDTLTYHAPLAAELVQHARTTDLLDRADVFPAYYPLNSNVVHALLILPFHRDFLSPFVNVGWAALAVFAAWCIGRRHGVAPLSALAAVLVLGLPMFGATQPGQASNDVVVTALFLAAIALLLEGELAVMPSALGGVAAGLALGTKLTAIAPVAALTVGVVVLAIRKRAVPAAVAWTVAVLVFGSYWYIRNWVHAGNPLPWFAVHLGPLHLTAKVHNVGGTLFENLSNGNAWRLLYLPGLWQALGRVWPVVLVLGATGGILTLFRRRQPLERLVGITMVLGFVGYLVTPLTGGYTFPYNLRFLAPVLTLGLVMLPTAFEGAGVVWRRALTVGFLAVVIVDATSPHRERIAAWPAGERAVAVLFGVGAFALGVVLLGLRRAPTREWIARNVVVVTAGASLLLSVVIASGWLVQRHYLAHRYADAEVPVDDIDAYFRRVHDSNVVVFGSVETYPMLGVDLSNRVTSGQGESTRLDADPCKSWPDVREGKYRYVVIIRYASSLVPPVGPPVAWFQHDASATEVVHEGASAVYRVDGPLRYATCPS